MRTLRTLEAFLSRYGSLDGFGVQFQAKKPGQLRALVFLEPLARAVFVDGKSTLVTTKEELNFSDPWELLDYLSSLAVAGHATDRTLPCIGGYLGYELLHQIERIPPVSRAPAAYPDLVFFLYGRTVAFDESGRISESRFSPVGLDGGPFWGVNETFSNSGDLHSEELNTTITSVDPELLKASLAPRSNFSQRRYQESISVIRELILDGEVYQVNLSQRFSLPFLDSAAGLFSKLYRVSPGSFSAYLNVTQSGARSSFSTLSASPELFLQRSGDELLSSPIKGTRPRHRDVIADALSCEELLASEKDRAELAMIVDLVRNDMGRIAQDGTVRVTNHARLSSLPQVHHLVSDVQCTTRDQVRFSEIIRALFPAGSITGAPKIAAMKYIAKLEGAPRGVYTGSIGSISPNGDFCFNVAIRTGTVSDNQLIFNAGGGITLDSIPEPEYQETLYKARPFFDALLKSESSEKTSSTMQIDRQSDL